MKTLEKHQESAAAQPAIKPIGDIAPVVAAGIQNKNFVATDEQVARFCAQVVAGKPTGKIFTAKMSEIDFSPMQRDAIKQARKTHKVNCIGAKKEIIRVLQAKSVRTVASKTNASGYRGIVGWVHDNAFNGKNGKFDQTRFDKFVEGPKPKALTA